MMRRVAVALFVLVLGAGMAHAQSAQKLSVQGSGALVFPTATSSDFTTDTKLGWEAQLRYTFSRFSLGAGYQRAVVFKTSTGSGSVSVLFAEPRYVVTAASTVAVYLAGRVGLGQLICNPEGDCAPQSAGLALGGGGGLLFKLSSRVSFDLGGQYFSTEYTNAPTVGGKTRTGFILARLGVSIGL
jgi:hypothetical protein